MSDEASEQGSTRGTKVALVLATVVLASAAVGGVVLGRKATREQINHKRAERLVVAVEQFQKKEGRYPASLAELEQKGLVTRDLYVDKRGEQDVFYAPEQNGAVFEVRYPETPMFGAADLEFTFNSATGEWSAANPKR